MHNKLVHFKYYKVLILLLFSTLISLTNVSKSVSNILVSNQNTVTNENYDLVLRKINFFSLQRNLKILGIFSRLSIRDGKERYLKYFPVTFNFIKSNLKSSLFFDMKKWIEELQIKELQL